MSDFKIELIERKLDGTMTFRAWREPTKYEPMERKCPHCGNVIYYRYIGAKDGGMYAMLSKRRTKGVRMRNKKPKRNTPIEFHCPECGKELYYRFYKDEFTGARKSKLSQMTREEYLNLLNRLEI